MMAKISKGMIALYTGIAIFITLILVLFSYLHANNVKNWWLVSLQTRIFFLPLIFYILAISIGFGVVTYILISLFRKSSYGGMEEKLRLLVAGNYDSDLVGEPLSPF